MKKYIWILKICNEIIFKSWSKFWTVIRGDPVTLTLLYITREPRWKILWSIPNMNFVMKLFHLQLEVVKYYYFKWKLHSLFASPESSKIAASKTLPAKIDTIQCVMPIWKFTKIIHMFSPNLLKTELISCNYMIMYIIYT